MTSESINVRLVAVEASVSEMSRLLEGSTQRAVVVMEKLEALAERHDETIYGIPGHAGIETRMDRLEQIEGRRTWNIRAMWTVIATVGSEAIYRMIGVGK